MSIPDYRGQTYVGYLDISGFKEMMKNETKARTVLDRFYGTIYETMYEVTHVDPTALLKINAIVVSDCAVLFMSRERDEEGNRDVDRIEGLSKLLDFIQKANNAFIDQGCNFPFTTTCSIAYGDFQYLHKTEIDNLRKNCMIGESYVKAYLDNENGEPKIRPSECRILKESLRLPLPPNPIFQLLKPSGKHYYFYWMLENPRDIGKFKLRYKDLWDGLYDQLTELLQNPIDQRDPIVQLT